MKYLKECDLSIYSIGEILSVCYLIEALAKLENLKTLNLCVSGYNCSKVGWIYLCKAFTKLKCVTSLKLHFLGVEFVTKLALHRLTSALEKIPQIEKLSLSLDRLKGIPDAKLLDFGNQLTSIKNIKELELNLLLNPNQGFQDKSVEKLIVILNSNPHYSKKPTIKQCSEGLGLGTASRTQNLITEDDDNDDDFLEDLLE